MKKMNNKGFLLAETLVVSTFVLTVLVLLFVQFKGLFNSYEDSYDYNTVEGIYNLNSMKKYILNNENKDNDLASQIPSSGYVVIVKNGSCQTSNGLSGLNYCDELAKEMNLKNLIFTSSDISSLNTSDSIFTESFKDFIKKIKNIEGKNRLIGQFNDGTYATITFDLLEDLNTALTCSEDTTVTSGDGLYIDEYENGRCVFRGSNPNNYITFNNETWRIVSIENDNTFKIVKNNDLGYMAWDSSGSNIWGNSSLKKYLNGQYFDSIIKSDRNLIVSHDFNIGKVSLEGDSYNGYNIVDFAAEKSEQWNGNIGLLTPSEYEIAHQYLNLYIDRGYQSFGFWTINAIDEAPFGWNYICTVSEDSEDSEELSYYSGSMGDGSYPDTNDQYKVLPALYLSSDIVLSGTGTEQDPYIIE